MRWLLFCSQADSKVLCGFIVPFWRLRLRIVNGPCAIRVDLLYFPVSVSFQLYPTLNFNWPCVTVSLYYYVFYHSYRIIALGLYMSFNASCLSAWIFLFFDIDLLTLDCSFSDLLIYFLHSFHSYTLIIRYDLPPDPWSDLPKVLLYFFFSFFPFYLCARFSVVSCWVLFHFYWRLA